MSSTDCNIVCCPYPDITIPGVDFPRTLFHNMSTTPGKLAAIDVHTGKTITYSQFIATAETIARNLIGQLGCRQNDVIAVYSPNSIEWTLFVAAVWRIGAIPCTYNSMLTCSELRTHLELSKPKFLFTVRSLADNVIDATTEYRSLKAVIVQDGSKLNNCIDFASLLINNNWQHCNLPTFDELHVNPSVDVALILFSSGTTGAQKAVLLSHVNLQSQFAVVCAPGTQLLSTNNIVFAPFAVVIGFTISMFSLAACKMLHIISRFNLRLYLEHVSRYRLDSLFIVPPVASMIVTNTQLVNSCDLTCVRHVISGGSPLSPHVEQQLIQCLPSVESVRQGYGMTELTGVFCATVLPLESVPRLPVPAQLNRHTMIRSHGTAGVPVYNTLMKIIDVNTGESLGPNKDGEICIKSPGVMLGYVNNPEATAATIDSDGWLHSGDIGHYDVTGLFTVVDRLKELIKYNAYQVCPAELEQLLLTHPAVYDAAVIGVPDTAAGELPRAYVVINNNNNNKMTTRVTALELEQFTAARVAPFKRLRGGVVFIDNIPRTASGKILRRQLKQLAAKL